MEWSSPAARKLKPTHSLALSSFYTKATCITSPWNTQIHNRFLCKTAKRPPDRAAFQASQKFAESEYMQSVFAATCTWQKHFSDRKHASTAVCTQKSDTVTFLVFYMGTPRTGNRKRTTTPAMTRDKITRSTQMIRISFRDRSMSVPMTQGMEAEKNRISDTHMMAVTY